MRFLGVLQDVRAIFAGRFGARGRSRRAMPLEVGWLVRWSFGPCDSRKDPRGTYPPLAACQIVSGTGRISVVRYLLGRPTWSSSRADLPSSGGYQVYISVALCVSANTHGSVHPTIHPLQPLLFPHLISSWNGLNLPPIVAQWGHFLLAPCSAMSTSTQAWQRPQMHSVQAKLSLRRLIPRQAAQ